MRPFEHSDPPQLAKPHLLVFLTPTLNRQEPRGERGGEGPAGGREKPVRVRFPPRAASKAWPLESTGQPDTEAVPAHLRWLHFKYLFYTEARRLAFHLHRKEKVVLSFSFHTSDSFYLVKNIGCESWSIWLFWQWICTVNSRACFQSIKATQQT